MTARARERKAAARRQLDEILRMSNLAPAQFARMTETLAAHARVALHFHPDRLDPQAQTVAESLLRQGVYKSQFETQLSNGSVSAFAGGARDGWEKALFGGAYHVESATHAHRPKYGALDLLRHADGPAPRFGSCYFLLQPAVSARATFTYLDSHQAPAERGTYAELDDILAALFADSFTGDCVLGERELPPTRLLRRLTEDLAQPFEDPRARAPMRNLNHYIEAQVHGELRLQEDVDILVADPSFAATDTGRTLQSMCDRYAIRLHWHAGFELPVEDVPLDFRGPTMPALAARVASDSGGTIDAHAIGEAARQVVQAPGDWADRGTQAEVLQELKLLWHVLVRFGQPHNRG